MMQYGAIPRNLIIFVGGLEVLVVTVFFFEIFELDCMRVLQPQSCVALSQTKRESNGPHLV